MPNEQQLETLRLLTLCLPGLPAVAAGVVALLGSARAGAVRAVSLAATLVCLGMAILLMIPMVSGPRTPSVKSAPPSAVKTFQPEFVPGATEEHPHATTWTMFRFGIAGGETGGIQFYFGIDGLNIWL